MATRFVLHRVPRINPPTVIRHYARREDLALNQLRQCIEPSRLERACWIAMVPLAAVSFYLVASL